MMAEETALTLEKQHGFRFKRRPISLAADFRPDWKIATLLLILHLSSHAGKSSLKRLHILNWALRSPKNRAEFEEINPQQRQLLSFQFRFDPGLGGAIRRAVGEKLVEWVGGDRLKRTTKGKG